MMTVMGPAITFFRRGWKPARTGHKICVLLHLRLFLPSGLFASSLPVKSLHALLLSPKRPTGPGPIGELFENDELDAIKSFAYLTSIVTQRGAMFSAAVVAAAVEKIDAGFDPFSPVRIAVEGTTYVIYKGMREALEAYLRVMLIKDKPRFYAIIPVEQASLFGAAVAALSR